jgi:molecular chaperone GrpE
MKNKHAHQNEEETQETKNQENSTILNNENLCSESKSNGDVESLEQKYDQLNDYTYLRLVAEFDNYRKRTIREKAVNLKNSGESILVNYYSFDRRF